MATTAIHPLVAPGQRRPMSLEDWLILADQGGPLTEWVDGEAIVFEMPSERHQELIGFLFVLLSWYTRKEHLGKVLFAPMPMRILSGSRWREPDILFVAAAHAARRTGSSIDGPADLVVEFVSDDSVRRDAQEKFFEYAAAGVAEYWLIDGRPGHHEARFFLLGPDRSYAAADLDPHGRYHSPNLPGFWLDLAWLWQEPLPDPDELKPAILAAAGADPASASSNG